MLGHRLRASCWLTSEQLRLCVLTCTVLVPLLNRWHLRQCVAIWTQWESVLGKDRLVPTFSIHPLNGWLADVMRYRHFVRERSCDIDLSRSGDLWLYDCEWDDLVLDKWILHSLKDLSWAAVENNIRYLWVSDSIWLSAEGSMCSTCNIYMTETTKSTCVALRESLWSVDETTIFNASLYELILKAAVTSPNLH